MDDRFGDDIGATSFAERLVYGQVAPRQGNHIATFEADFDTKTLSGKLSVKQKKTKTTTKPMPTVMPLMPISQATVL